MAGFEKIKVGSYTLPNENLTGYKVTLSDADLDSDRADDGILLRNRVRANITKVELSLKTLTDEQVSDIIEAITPVSFSTTYWWGKNRTGEFYAGDKSIELIFNDDGEPYWNMDFNLIEI